MFSVADMVDQCVPLSCICQVKVDAKTKTYLDEYKAEKRKELKKVTSLNFAVVFGQPGSLNMWN